MNFAYARDRITKIFTFFPIFFYMNMNGTSKLYKSYISMTYVNQSLRMIFVINWNFSLAAGVNCCFTLKAWLFSKDFSQGKRSYFWGLFCPNTGSFFRFITLEKFLHRFLTTISFSDKDAFFKADYSERNCSYLWKDSPLNAKFILKKSLSINWRNIYVFELIYFLS